jgi:DNA ligase (NAD+)
MNAKSEIERLRKDLERHNRLYYAGEPEITDYEFDQRLRRLQELEAKHPEFADPNSPMARVGGEPIAGFPTVVHDPPMLSMRRISHAPRVRERHPRGDPDPPESTAAMNRWAALGTNSGLSAISRSRCRR